MGISDVGITVDGTGVEELAQEELVYEELTMGTWVLPEPDTGVVMELIRTRFCVKFFLANEKQGQQERQQKGGIT